MPTFTLTLAQIASIASLHAVTPQKAPDRQMTPILTAIHVTVTPGTLTAVATDRYVMTSLTFPMGDYVHTLDAESPLAFTMDSKDWQALAKLAGAQRHGFILIGVETDGGLISASWDWGQIIGQYDQIAGGYPPVARLFPTETRALDSLPYVSPDTLNRAMKAWHPGADSARERADIIWQIAMGADRGHKLAPLVLTAHTPAGVELRSLVQPKIPPR